MSNPRVLAIVNHKGGPGKTTTAVAIARHYQRLGHRPLAIDLDPQGNLTRILGGCIGPNNSIGDVLMRRTTLDRATQLGHHGIHLVGSDIKLEDTSAAMQTRSPNHVFLRSALRFPGNAPCPGVVIVDCAPAANILTVNALVAADAVVVVVDPEHDAIDGMRRIMALIESINEDIRQVNPDWRGPSVLGAVVNRVQAHTVLHRANLDVIAAETTVLGMVPYRRGVDAEREIEQAFAPIADAIWTQLEDL